MSFFFITDLSRHCSNSVVGGVRICLNRGFALILRINDGGFPPVSNFGVDLRWFCKMTPPKPREDLIPDAMHSTQLEQKMCVINFEEGRENCVDLARGR